MNIGNHVDLPILTCSLSTTASPTSLPPITRPATAPGMLFRSKALDTILVTATEQSGVVGEGFHSVAFPAASERARFLWFCQVDADT